MDKTVKLTEKELMFVEANLVAEVTCLKLALKNDQGNVVGINTLSKEEKTRKDFLESFLKKIRKE